MFFGTITSIIGTIPKRLLFVYACLGLATALLIILLWVRLTPPGIGGTPEQADTGIGQYADRDGSTGASPQAILEGPLVPGCSLRFSYEPESKTLRPGSVGTYVLTLINKGRETCDNVSFSVYYAENETFVSSSPAPSASDYYWRAGNLRSNKSYAVILRTTLGGSEGDVLANEACATADNAKEDVCAGNTIFLRSSAPRAAAPGAERAASVATLAGREFGTWIWSSPLQMSPEHAEEMLDAAKRESFTAVYVTIDDYLSVAALPAGTERQRKQKEYSDALARFVDLARARGIAVDAEGGARDWAIPENRWKGYALIRFVKEYNAAYPKSKIRALQYDVEPYLLPEYEGNKAAVLRQFVEFVDESAREMQGSDADFSIVIPHFYDSNQAWTPSFSYGGKTKHAYTHLLNALERKPGSTILIMAYRNFFLGEDGTREIAAPEIKEASLGGYSTRIIVAQESGNVEPSYVTFYSLPKADLILALSDINEAFKGERAFGGIAAHYLDTFLALE